MTQEFDNNLLDLVKQKGFYPYKYMTDYEKFKEGLPRKEKFYSSLMIEKLVTKNMNLLMFKKIEMKMMKDYHDLFLKCDVPLLIDEFGKFRNNSLKKYGLCPHHYLSAPGLSWDAMLKMAKIELELIPDSNMYIFFERGTRGGISDISNRYSKANNRHLKSYDPKQELKHIYLNVNNLYDYAMSKFPPTSGFKWIDPKEFDLNKYTSNSSRGFKS